jgi:hypothetical protein
MRLKSIYTGVLLFIFSSILNAYPYRFRRLILVKNNTIIRIVDFISEKHFIIDEPSIKQEDLFKDEAELFSVTERSLLSILRQLANSPTQEKIQLLWEWNDEQLQRPEVMKSSLLPYGGWQFRKEFNKDQNKKIEFIPTDTYRFNRALFLFLIYPRVAWYGQFKHEQFTDAMAFITDILHNRQSNPQKDLERIKNINPEAYKWLDRLWNDYKELRLMPFYERYIKPLLDENKAITLQQVKEHSSFEFFKGDFIEMVLPGIMNFELLFTIFKSPVKHIIVYAGGRHCADVVEDLIKYFDFQEVIDVGVADDVRGEDNYRIILSTKVWDLLKEKPTTSFERFKKDGVFKHVIDRHYFQKLALVKTSSPDQLLAILKEGSDAYLDAANAQDENDKKTLLMMVVEKNDYKKTELLLKYGAYPNKQDMDGNTALFSAVQQGNDMLVNLLLTHGADPCIKNNQGKKPLDYATKTTIQALLQQYTTKSC